MRRVLAALVVVLGVGASPAGAADSTFVVNATADAPDANPGDGVCQTAQQTCTLRAALAEVAKAKEKAAQATTSTSVKLVDPQVSILLGAGSHDLSEKPLEVTGAVTITGEGAQTTTLDVGEGARGLEVAGGSLELKGVRLRGGVGAGTGGAAIRAREADLTLRKVVVEGAASDGDGGAILVAGGRLVIEDSDLHDNAGHNGGAVFAARSEVRVTASRFTGNGTSGSGGALFLSYPTAVVVEGSSFVDGTATGEGGAVYLEGAGAGQAPFELAGTFTGNSARSSGGAVAVRTTSDGRSERSLRIGVATFADNDGAAGGALAVTEGVVVVEGATFTGNRATRGSGGAVLAGGDLTLKSARFERNEATELGGAVTSAGLARVEGSTFAGNRAGSLGGALALSGIAAPAVRSSTFESNVAETGGGAVWRAGAGLDQDGNRMTGNLPEGDDVKMAEHVVEHGGGGTTSRTELREAPVRVVAAAAGAAALLVLAALLLVSRRIRRRRRAAAGGTP